MTRLTSAPSRILILDVMSRTDLGKTLPIWSLLSFLRMSPIQLTVAVIPLSTEPTRLICGRLTRVLTHQPCSGIMNL